MEEDMTKSETPQENNSPIEGELMIDTPGLEHRKLWRTISFAIQ